MKFEDYLIIEETEIKAKFQSKIVLDLNDFGDNIIETARSFIVPGIVEIYIPEKDLTVPIILDYNVNISRTNEEIDEEGRHVFT
ncbi:MAG: hypothetical protein H7836_18310, partial [Magnetococcus sp. YQC-3]